MRRQTLFKILFIMYLILLLYITLFAWNYGASLGPAGPGGRNYNIIPFRSIYRIGVFSPTWVDPIRILLGNIIMFIPLGFFIPIIWKRKRSLIKVVFLGFFLSLCIELSQFLFTHRVANIDDVILNTFGTWIGVCVFLVMNKLKRRFIIFTA